MSGRDEHKEASGELLPRSAAPSDPIEQALTKALTEASAAGRFDVVAQLARELEARRLASAGGGKVVPIDRARGGKR